MHITLWQRRILIAASGGCFLLALIAANEDQAYFSRVVIGIVLAVAAATPVAGSSMKGGQAIADARAGAEAALARCAPLFEDLSAWPIIRTDVETVAKKAGIETVKIFGGDTRLAYGSMLMAILGLAEQKADSPTMQIYPGRLNAMGKGCIHVANRALSLLIEHNIIDLEEGDERRQKLFDKLVKD